MRIEQGEVERRNCQVSISDDDKPRNGPMFVNKQINVQVKTYIVPLITGAVLFPKIIPPGCAVIAVVPVMFSSGVYVVFSWEIHAANCKGRGCRQMPCKKI